MSSSARLSMRLGAVLVAGLLVAVLAPVPPTPAGAGVAQVGSSSNGSSGSRRSITLKRPSGTAAGHVMVASIVTNDDDRVTAPAGWTPVRADSVKDRLHQAVYLRVARSGEPKAYTWKVPKHRRIAGGITTYAGVDTTNPVDVHAGLARPTPGTAVTAPSVSPSVPGTLLVALVAINAEGSFAPPPGMTKRWKALSRHKKKPTDALALSADGGWATAAATGTRTASATKPGASVGVLLALRPGAAPPPPPAPAPAGDPVLVGAGDIASCDDNTGARATAALLDRIDGTVFTLGDNVYLDGTAAEFRNCYEPTWGRHKSRTAMAVAGNHDYNTPGGAGHYGYFGAAAGDPARGYFDTKVGDWHVIVLNSNCEKVGGCGAGSPQEEWLRRVLAASDARCTVAMWHQPAFSSATSHRAFPTYQPFWQALHDHGADMVLVGSDHVYERFALQNPSGDADTAFGLRQFTVGTGGRSHQTFKAALPNSEVRNGATYGVLKLTLHPGSYDWTFVPEAGQTFTDSGSTACHGAPPAPAPDPGPVVRIGSSSNAAGKATSLTLGRPAGTVAGHVMVASVVTSDGTASITRPDGWTVLRNDAVPGVLRQTLYTKVAGAAEPPSYTWTLSGQAQIAGGLSTYAGVDTARPVDVHQATVQPSAGRTVTAPSITTTSADGRLIQFTAVNAEGTLVAPTGMTQRWLAAAPTGKETDALAASFDARLGAAGPTGGRSATATEPGAAIAVSLALRPAVTGPAQP
jgi:hypothetical protein